MKWISVDEKTPNNYENVLVYCGNGNRPGNINVFTWNDKWYKMNMITHWMPLPEPPKKKKNP